MNTSIDVVVELGLLKNRVNQLEEQVVSLTEAVNPTAPPSQLVPRIEPIKGQPKSLEARIESFERSVIIDALERCEGNVARASRDLEVPPRTFWRKIQKHKIKTQEYGKPDR